MSDEHEHDPTAQAEAEAEAHAAAPRDPRLDAAGAEHPAVRPSNFDLIALEHTRSGLRVLGVGLGLWSFAHPLIAQLLSDAAFAAALAGWSLNALALLCLIGAIWICAPTPQGPFPRWFTAVLALVFAAGLASSALHLYSLLSGFVPAENLRRGVGYVDNSARIACLLLPWILWRFCQFRGLTGRAIVWLWFAMASSGVAVAVTTSDMRWWLVLFPPLGVIAFFAAQHTARDVWLDAVYRHTRFYVVRDPTRVVEPLRPANER
jgi:hypothetical protein